MSQTSEFPQATPGQFQPAYTQAPQGQPLPTPQAQPGQYYAQPGQQAQPGQASQGQPLPTPQAQPGQYYAQPGQQAQPGQASQGQPLPTPQAQPGQYYAQPGQQIQAVGQQAQLGQRPNRGKSTTPPTTAYWKSAFIADKLVEFFMLLATWICIVSFSNGAVVQTIVRTNYFQADGGTSFFKGITVFSWVMVIVFQIAFAFFSNITQRYFSKPRHFTIICLVVQVILTLLLIACTINLMPLAHDFTKVYNILNDSAKTTLVNLLLALIFGSYVCLCFVDDVRSLYKMMGTQKAEEQAVVVNQQQMVGAFAQSVPTESGTLDSQT